MGRHKGRGLPAQPSGGADISEFADIVRETWRGGGIYRALRKDTGAQIGYLRYMIRLDNPTVIMVRTTYTDPAWRGRRVGTALGERLHLDHPDHFLDLGTPRLDDLPTRQFWEHQQAAQPDWDTTVTQVDAPRRAHRKGGR